MDASNCAAAGIKRPPTLSGLRRLKNVEKKPKTKEIVDGANAKDQKTVNDICRTVTRAGQSV